MEFEILARGIVAGLLGLSAYSKYRGRKIAENANKIAENANKRVDVYSREYQTLFKQLQRQVRENEMLGLPTTELENKFHEDNRALLKKHNLVQITLDTSVPGPFESEKVVQLPNGDVKRYVSNGEKWVRYE